ncbi:NUDIX hydrolase [Clostridiales bacterium TF09-2AC]|nr:NUDIX hydrolase [Clostridiales bacterium TF09-2AC]
MDRDTSILDRNGLTEAEYLQSYDPGHYERPSMAADMAIFTVLEETEDNYRKLPEKELGILLIQRGVHPYLGSWALPGGFVRPDETTEQAARRELMEETGLNHVYMEQLYTFSDPDRDPRTWVMSCSYMALIDSSKVRIKAGDDADNARWFHISFYLMDEHTDYPVPTDGEEPKVVRIQHYKLELTSDNICLSSVIEKSMTKTENGTFTEYKITENNGLAFDHARIITYALERLRGKVEYSGLALHLMPSEFTLTQLQQVYEVILGKRLLKAAFRRKAASLVEETDSYTGNEGHRPSRLYRKKWKEF